MTDLPERMVEAGARAISEARGCMWAKMVQCLDRSQQQRHEDPCDCTRDARACLTAALALAEGEGAILTLVPDGAMVTLYRERDGTGDARVNTNPNNDDPIAVGATPALALCIAALKARGEG